MIEVEYLNFWQDFDPENNLFQDFFSANPQVVDQILAAGHKKVVFESVFAPKKKQKSFFKKKTSDAEVSNNICADKKEIKPLRIWFTGENLRPPLEKNYDAYLSFDHDDFGNRNFYFPLIYLSLNPYRVNGHPRIGEKYLAKDLLIPRTHRSGKIAKSICVISSSSTHRLGAVKELEKYFQVDVYGSMGEVSPLEKITVAKSYEFMLCFENDLYPGYTTEKIVEAYVCGTIPLYWGMLDNCDFLNKKSFLNLANSKSIEIWAKELSQISEKHYKSMFQEPLLSDVPPIEETLLELFSKFIAPN